MDVNNFSVKSIRYAVGGNSNATTLYDNLTNPVSLQEISESITFRLRTVHTQASPIKVSKKRILNVIDRCYRYIPSW